MVRMDELTSWVLEQVGVDADMLTDDQVGAIMSGSVGIVHRVEDDGIVTDLMPVVKSDADN